jgi:hypothetical protein
MNQIKRLWLVSAFTLAACGEGPPDEQVGGTETLTFSSSDQALSWLAARARNRSGTHLLTDATGTVRSITFDNENARDGLLGEFDHFKVVRVAGIDYPTGEEARVSALTSGIPDTRYACNGPFCIASRATNTHWSVFGIGYNEVSGRTEITSGAAETFYCSGTPPFAGQGGVLPPGAPNSFIRCASGYTRSNEFKYQTLCRNPTGGVSYGCVKQTGPQSLGVAVTYFSNTQSCGGGQCVTTPIAIRTDQAVNSGYDAIELGMTSLGRLVLPCSNGQGPGECYVDGVCVSSSGNANAFSAQTSSAAGSYDCPGFRRRPARRPGSNASRGWSSQR